MWGVFLVGQRKGGHPALGKSGSFWSIQLVCPHRVVTMVNQRQSAIISAETVWISCMYLAVKNPNLCNCKILPYKNCLYTSHQDFRLCKWWHQSKGAKKAFLCLPEWFVTLKCKVIYPLPSCPLKIQSERMGALNAVYLNLFNLNNLTYLTQL